jgi:hypothetical protein
VIRMKKGRGEKSKEKETPVKHASILTGENR